MHPRLNTALEKAPSSLRFAGAVQNAFIETQKPPINLAETLRIGKPSQKCASFWNAAVFCRFGMMRGVVRIVPRVCTVNLNLVS